MVPVALDAEALELLALHLDVLRRIGATLADLLERVLELDPASTTALASVSLFSMAIPAMAQTGQVTPEEIPWDDIAFQSTTFASLDP